MASERFGIVIGVLGVAIAAGALGYQIFSDRKKTLVSKESRFYCALQADPQDGGEVWTVMYRNGRGYTKPWLRMVRSMGGTNEQGQSWNPQERCEEIATRKLEIYREDGLIAFNYRPDPSTPGQYVLCAVTQLSGDSCLQVLTLMPEDDPYMELREVAGALLPGNPASYQGSGELTIENPLEIPLEEQL